MCFLGLIEISPLKEPSIKTRIATKRFSALLSLSYIALKEPSIKTRIATQVLG